MGCGSSSTGAPPQSVKPTTTPSNGTNTHHGTAPPAQTNSKVDTVNGDTQRETTEKSSIKGSSRPGSRQSQIKKDSEPEHIEERPNPDGKEVCETNDEQQRPASAKSKTSRPPSAKSGTGSVKEPRTGSGSSKRSRPTSVQGSNSRPMTPNGSIIMTNGQTGSRPSSSKKPSSRPASAMSQGSVKKTPTEEKENSNIEPATRIGSSKSQRSRPPTPQDKSSRPVTPQDKSSRPITPQDKSSRPPTPKDKSSRPNTPQDKPSRSTTPQESSSRPPSQSGSRPNSSQNKTSKPASAASHRSQFEITTEETNNIEVKELETETIEPSNVSQDSKQANPITIVVNVSRPSSTNRPRSRQSSSSPNQSETRNTEGSDDVITIKETVVDNPEPDVPQEVPPATIPENQPIGTDEDPDVDSDANAEVIEKNKDGGKALFMGRETIIVKSRLSAEKEEVTRPVSEDGNPWTDPDFTQEMALKGIEEDFEWKRPEVSETSEDIKTPCLFSEGSSRFDIEQGSAGTCWFLSVLASLADKPDVIKQIIPEDSYRLGKDDYDGIFHCRFWKDGGWEDVYIDDCLPYLEGNILWGAKSKDSSEMWVALMEKAFAKFHGSYQNISGGWSGEAFVTLTGGVAEPLHTDTVKTSVLFPRIRNAINTGSVITCLVPVDKSGVNGLVGGHEYTITAAAKVPKQGKLVSLVRVRNPWGKSEGEWNGPWSDGSQEWEDVDPDIKERLKVKTDGDGEFWLTMQDFRDHFTRTSICSFCPDFDQDGKDDGLDKVTAILGEWKEDSAAGCDLKQKFKNPKYSFTVPETEEKCSPTVVQFLQSRKHRKDDNLAAIRADLYKVISKYNENKEYVYLSEITNNKIYTEGSDVTYRYSLKAGDYILVPTTMSAGIEKEFCLRLFSQHNIESKHLLALPGVFVNNASLCFQHKGVSYETSAVFSHSLGKWAGVSAGGQVSNTTYENNPQFAITVKGDSKQPVTISLVQEQTDETLPIGFQVYQRDDDPSCPLDLQTLYSMHKSCPKPVDGGTTFVINDQSSGNFLLDPGHYVILGFTDKPEDEKVFVLTINSDSDISCRALEKSA